MLACAQDIYFNNENSLPRQDSFQSLNLPHPTNTITGSFEHQQKEQQRPKVSKKTHMIPHHHSEKDKEEQVWPPEVESAFIEALETIPKLGRRKILVNGKPCGRNELISDFIFRKTSKVRTRKQVSSHIQVLKNTRKNDPHFMHLLTDSVDLDDDFTHRKNQKTAGKRPQQKLKHHSHQQTPSTCFLNQNTSLPLGKVTAMTSTASISSDESSIHSSPSPADYVFDMMYGDDRALSLLDIKDPFYDSMHHSLFDPSLGVTASTQASSSAPPNPSNDLPSSATHLPVTTPTTAGDAFINASTTGISTPSIVNSPCFVFPGSDMMPSTSDSMSHLFPTNAMYGLQIGTNNHPTQQEHQQLQSQEHQQQSRQNQQQFQQQQQQQQQQQYHPSYYSHQNQLHNSSSIQDTLSEIPGRSSCGQPKKWKRGPKRQKSSKSQHQRKGHQHFGGFRPSSVLTSSSLSLGQQKQNNLSSSIPRPVPSSSSTLSTSSTSTTSSNESSFDFRMPSTLDTTPTEMPMTTIPPPSYEAPLWPNYLCLYLEYATAGNPSMTTSHTLAQLPHCFPIPKSSIPSTSDAMKERYLSLAQLNPSLSLISPDATLFAKMKLDLNFNMNDFFFNNTCFFESKDRRMIECTTTIYSFGKVVLESKEMQQALWVPEGKYMYSFVYVNQFFDAFMKGVQSLQSWEEVDIAIHNLCIVQVFEDMEAKCHSSYLVDSNLPTNTSPTSSSSSSATITETTANLQPLESVINENNKDQYQIMMNYPCSPQEPSSSSSSSTSSSTSSATTPASSTSSSSSLSTLFNSTVKNCIHPSITKHGGTGSHLLAVVYEFERGQGTIDMTTIHEDVSQKAQQQQQHHQDTIMS